MHAVATCYEYDFVFVWSEERASYNIPERPTKLDIRTFTQCKLTHYGDPELSGIIKGKQLKCVIHNLTVFIHMHILHPTDARRLGKQAYGREASKVGIPLIHRSKINELEGDHLPPGDQCVSFTKNSLWTCGTFKIRQMRLPQSYSCTVCSCNLCLPKKQVSV